MPSYAERIIAHLERLGGGEVLTEDEAFAVVHAKVPNAARKAFAANVRKYREANPDTPLLVVDKTYSLKRGDVVVVPKPRKSAPVAEDDYYLNETAESAQAEIDAAAAIAAATPPYHSQSDSEPPAPSVSLPVVRAVTHIKLVSWNLGSAASACLKNARRQVLGVVAAIVAENPDVIALQETVKDMIEFEALFPGYKLKRPEDNLKSDHAFLVHERCQIIACTDVHVPTWGSKIAGAGHAGHGTTRDPPAMLIVNLGAVHYAVVSVHAPPVPRPDYKGDVDTRVHDVFMNRVLGAQDSVRACVRACGFADDTLVVMAGDWNEQVHAIVQLGRGLKMGVAMSGNRGWAFSGDRYTWTANSGGYDFFAIEDAHAPLWTMAQYEIQQTVRKNTSPGVAGGPKLEGVLGASNHDPVVLDLRSRFPRPRVAVE